MEPSYAARAIWVGSYFLGVSAGILFCRYENSRSVRRWTGIACSAISLVFLLSAWASANDLHIQLRTQGDTATIESVTPIGGQPSPVPTASPRPTAVPTQTPQPATCQCPDGSLSGTIAPGWFGLGSIDLPPGVTKRFCANVGPPLLPADQWPRKIVFEFAEIVHDLECAQITMRVEQCTGAHVAKSLINPSPAGQVLYLQPPIGPTKPELTAPGKYVVALTGHAHDPSCGQTVRSSWQATGDLQ